MNFFTILRDSLYFYRHNVISILQVCLPLILTIAISRVLVDTQAVDTHVEVNYALLFYGVCILLLQPIYTAALILYINERRDGLRPQIIALWLKALKRWPAMVLMGLLYTFSILLGAVLLLVPALWILVKFNFAQYLLIARGLGPVDALKTSFIMTRGYFWLTCSCMFGIFLSIVLFEVLMAIFLGLFQNPLLSLVLYTLSGLLQSVVLTVMFRLFTLIEKAGASPLPACTDDKH